MKVFFIGDRRDKERLASYKNIIKELEKNGAKVDKSWIDRTSDEDAGDFEGAYRRNMKAIKDAELLVAEITELTSGVGFLVSTALNQKKPVLALFDRESHTIASSTLKGSSNRLLSYTEYDATSLGAKVREFFDKIKGLMDTKFILIISPEIDRYLEWASAQRRMHKAQIVRQAVEDVMLKDKEYKMAGKDSE